MFHRTILSLAILTTQLSCNFNSQIKDKVETTEKDAKVAMDSELSSIKADFSKAYELLLLRQLDSTLSTKTKNIYKEINSTTKFIDSLRLEMNKLNNMETENVELVRSLFLENGIGDSIMEKLKDSYQLAINSTTSEADKLRLIKVQTTFSEETKKHAFQMNSPLGVSILLFGFESELLKDAMSCFNKM